MLVARGHITPEQVDRFFNPTPEALHSPWGLQDMDKAVSLLKEALSEGKRVLVHGDYDCDGITSTAILTEVIGTLSSTSPGSVSSRLMAMPGEISTHSDACPGTGKKPRDRRWI